MVKVSECSGCSGCPMRDMFPDNAFVPMQKGPEKRMLIGEAPGETEAAEGRPFAGGSGKILDALLSKAGVDRSRINVLNVIQCRPPNNVFPTDGDYLSKSDAEKAVRQCVNNYVLPALREVSPSRVDLVGDKALRHITGRTEGIFKWRGSPIAIAALGVLPIAVPTLHPSYLMRDQTMMPVAVNDFRKSLVLPKEEYILKPSLEQVKAFVATEFAFDIETAYWWGDATKITMVGISSSPTTAMVVPFQGGYVAELKRIFHNATRIIGHNSIQFDLPVLQANEVQPRDGCELWDTMLLQHLRFPDLPHDLEFVGSQFSNKPAWKSDKKDFELYCARDVDVTFQAFKQLKPMIVQAGLMDLYQSVSVPIAKICRLMHETGFKVDGNRIHGVREKLIEEMKKLELALPEWLRTKQVTVRKRQPAPKGTLGKSGKPVKYIHVEAQEEEIPWRSTDNINKFLYQDLALPTQTDVKTEKITTGKMALDKLYRKTKNPAIQALRKLRQMNSLVTLFCKEEMVSVDRMFPHFNVHGTASGRLSSSDPNLQNVPESARYIYVPSHIGWKIIDVDFSGIENRLTAHIAGDTARLERMISDPSFSEHRYLASIITGIPYEEIEKDNDKDAPYGKAKRVVHGGNYGLGAKKMSLMYDMDLKETKEIMDRWKQEIAPTVLWQNRCAEEAKKSGFLTTPFGRRRWFYTASYYTESLSFLPQSTAADVIFRAMLALMYERINWPIEKVQKVVRIVEPLPKPAQLLLQVHDSLVLEAPEQDVPKVVEVLKKVMEQPWPELGGLSIPIGVKVGNSWAECETYKSPLA